MIFNELREFVSRSIASLTIIDSKIGIFAATQAVQKRVILGFFYGIFEA